MQHYGLIFVSPITGESIVRVFTNLNDPMDFFKHETASMIRKWNNKIEADFLDCYAIWEQKQIDYIKTVNYSHYESTIEGYNKILKEFNIHLYDKSHQAYFKELSQEEMKSDTRIHKKFYNKNKSKSNKPYIIKKKNKYKIERINNDRTE